MATLAQVILPFANSAGSQTGSVDDEYLPKRDVKREKRPKKTEKSKKAEKSSVSDDDELKKTKSKYDTSFRHYQLTIFDKDDEGRYEKIKKYLLGLKNVTYFVSCREVCPKSLNVHWHIYVHFNKPQRLAGKKCFYSHLELCRGNGEENRDYIRKEGKHKDAWNDDPKNHENLFEWGDVPRGVFGRLGVEELKLMNDEQIIGHDARCHKAYMNARDLLNDPLDLDIEDWQKKVTAFYIHGWPETGKSELAKAIIRALFPVEKRKVNVVKYENSFWSGVGNAEIAIYDDFRSSDMKPKEFVNFIDYNKQNLNVKGGNRRNKYSTIIITSVERLSEIYSGMKSKEPRRQWMRRLTVLDMYSEEKVMYESDENWKKRLEIMKRIKDEEDNFVGKSISESSEENDGMSVWGGKKKKIYRK